MPKRRTSVQISSRPDDRNPRGSLATGPQHTPYQTPRRACKDLALARLLVPVDLQPSSSDDESPDNSSDSSYNSVVSDATAESLESPDLRLRSLSISGSQTTQAGTKWRSRATLRANQSNTPRKLSSKVCSPEQVRSARKRLMTTVAHSACRPSKPVRPMLPKRTLSVEPIKRRPTFRSNDYSAECLPGREDEFEAIKTFVAGKLAEDSGGCMYISGLPGTGKTASVNAVLACLSNERLHSTPAFQWVTVNGMQVDDPKQVYVQIYQHITGQLISPKLAAHQLELEFCAPSVHVSRKKSQIRRCSPVVLVIDELDLLCTRRQDVLYNLFDWPTRPRGRRCLIVLAIANTMDLPERMLHPRVASRFGLTRLTFAPYTHEQLAHIVRSRLAEDQAYSFQDKALELASRKVAAVSGDVRRALDICRRAVEMAKQTKATQQVGIQHINAAIKEMFTTPKTNAIRACSVYEKVFLQALVAEFQARSTEEARLDRCIRQMCALCRLQGMACPTTSEVFGICSSLGAYKLLLTEPSRRDTSMLVRLNCSKSDVVFALRQRTGG